MSKTFYHVNHWTIFAKLIDILFYIYIYIYIYMYNFIYIVILIMYVIYLVESNETFIARSKQLIPTS